MSCLKQLLSLCFYTLLISDTVYAKALTLPYQDSAEDSYASELVASALAEQKIETPMVHHPQSLSGERLENAFDEGEIDIIWQSGKTASNTSHHILKIPVFRGLMNSYRIVTRKGDAMPSLTGLRKLEMGMFRDDGIVSALKQNGYNVIRVKYSDNLTAMLLGERFDVALIPAARFASASHSHLTPSDYMVNVENPWFFIVHKNRPDIAQALREGLVAMLENGTLDQLFRRTPWMVDLHNERQNEKTEIVTLPYVAQPDFEIAQEFMLVDSSSTLLSASF